MRSLGVGLIVGALLAGPVRAGEPEPGLVAGEVRLASHDDVTALCSALAADITTRDEALGSTYVVTVPADGYSLLPYDAARARAAVDVKRGFRSRVGAFELVEHDLTGGARAAGAAPALDMAVPASAAEAAELARGQRSGTLVLTVWFQIAHPEGPSCAAVHQVDRDGVRLAIEPLAFELTTVAGVSGKVERVASGESPAFVALRAEAGPVLEPRVIISPPLLTRARGKAPQAIARAAAGLETDLLPCYKDGLTRAPALRGEVVAGVELAGGKVVGVRQEVDSLGMPEVTECVFDHLRRTRFPAGVRERVSIPIRFGSAD